MLWSSSSKGKSPCPATDRDTAMLTLDGSTGKQYQELLTSAQQQITPWSGFYSRNTTTDLQKIPSNGICRIEPGALCWDLLDTVPKSLCYDKERNGNSSWLFLCAFCSAPCRGEVSQKVFFTHFSCAGARTVHPGQFLSYLRYIPWEDFHSYSRTPEKLKIRDSLMVCRGFSTSLIPPG